MDTNYFDALQSLQVSPKLLYEFIETGVEVERLKFQAQRIINTPDAYDSFERIQQGERLLCFMRRSIGRIS